MSEEKKKKRIKPPKNDFQLVRRQITANVTKIKSLLLRKDVNEATKVELTAMLELFKKRRAKLVELAKQSELTQYIKTAKDFSTVIEKDDDSLTAIANDINEKNMLQTNNKFTIEVVKKKLNE